MFFSRIVPKKNLATVIRAMPLVKGNIRLSIAGPVEDAKYWARCIELINDTDHTERIRYVGMVKADEVVSFLGGFDLLVLPTLSENFGHVVLESLAAAPLSSSDTTHPGDRSRPPALAGCAIPPAPRRSPS